MTRAPSRVVWLAIGTSLVLLPILPLQRWSGAPDIGPGWLPHVQSWGIGLSVVVVVAVLVGRLMRRSVLPRWRLPRLPVPAVLALLAAALTAVSAYAMRAVFAANPHVIDEMAQLFHARMLAAGLLAAPVPEPAEAFLITHTWIAEAGWVSQFPPGQTALLAIGLLLNAEWLVNPVLGGLSVLLVYLVARGLYGTKTAKVAAFLWAASAWVLFMSATFMSHVGAATLALAGWAALWAPRQLRRAHFALAGVALAATAATRPLDGVAAALPVLVWLGSTRSWHRLPWLGIGALPVGLVWGYLNWRMYGSPLTLGYTALYGAEHGLGFHLDPWGRSFTPFVAISNTAVAIRRLHIYLFEWPIPALLPLALWATVARHRNRSDLLLAVGATAAPLLYFFYWHSAPYPGPRFYYVAAPMLVIATARAWVWMWRLARRAATRIARWDVALAVAAVLVVAWGWVAILPARFEVYRNGLATLKLHPERELAAKGVEAALVLVPESWGSRVMVHLWTLGVPPGQVERAYNRVDTCDLHQLVLTARGEELPSEETGRRLEHLIATTPTPVPRVMDWYDSTVRLRSGQPPAEDCQTELRRDQTGFTLFGYLAWRNSIGLNSGIVFARDLYEGNDRLLARYPGWDVWRFAPPPGEPDGRPVLTLVRARGESTGEG